MPRARAITPGVADKGRITRLQRFGHIGRHRRVVIEIGGGIEGACLRRHSSSFLQVSRQRFGGGDVLLLRAFVSAAKQDNHRRPAPREIDPVTRALMYPQFAHAFADGSDIARIAKRQTPNSRRSSPWPAGPRASRAIREDFRFADFEHGHT